MRTLRTNCSVLLLVFLTAAACVDEGGDGGSLDSCSEGACDEFDKYRTFEQCDSRYEATPERLTCYEAVADMAGKTVGVGDAEPFRQQTLGRGLESTEVPDALATAAAALLTTSELRFAFERFFAQMVDVSGAWPVLLVPSVCNESFEEVVAGQAADRLPSLLRDLGACTLRVTRDSYAELAAKLSTATGDAHSPEEWLTLIETLEEMQSDAAAQVCWDAEQWLARAAQREPNLNGIDMAVCITVSDTAWAEAIGEWMTSPWVEAP